MFKTTLLLALALSLAAAGPCGTGDDCDQDECCVSNIQPLGRRGVRAMGTCRKLGLEKQSCVTRLVDTLVAGGKPSEMVLSCPCAEGLSCLASTSSPFIIPVGRQGVCVRGKVEKRQKWPTEGSCGSGADCADDECCISRFQPIGKRQLGFNSGYCQKMGGTDAGCYVNQANGKPEGMAYQCPCQKGLTCNPGERPMFVMPLGQVGTCQ